MAEYVYLELPLPPSVNSIWRSAGKRVYRSPSYRKWLDDAGWLIRQHGKIQKVSGFVGIEVKFVKPDQRKHDLDNLLKVVGDFLVHNQIIEDDSKVMRWLAEWVPTGAPCQLMVISTKEVA